MVEEAKNKWCPHAVIEEFMAVKIKFCGELEARKTKIEKIGDDYLMQLPMGDEMYNAGKVSEETIRLMIADMLKRLPPNAEVSGRLKPPLE